MAVINIGAGAADRSSVWSSKTNSGLDLTNPADGTGIITSLSFWANSNIDSVKTGVFFGSGTDWTSRDFENIGSVTAGSKQTFTGLDLDVVEDDIIGLYLSGSTGGIERALTGCSGILYSSGDVFDGVERTYTLIAGDCMSVEGTGATAAAGKEINGVTISEWNGVAISEWNGI